MKAFMLYEGDRIRFIAPYVREFVESMKALIPHRSREWKADESCWLISRGHEPELLNVAERFYDRVEALISVDEADERSEAARRTGLTEGMANVARPSHTLADCISVIARAYPHEYWLGLFPQCTDDRLVQAAYRARALKLHPDIAGAASTQAMTRLNLAREVLLSRCGAVLA